MGTQFGHTADGFETQFGTNYLGHFVLINRIAPLIRSGGRVVILSSGSHTMADVDLDDPNFEKTAYDRWVAYARSKTASILFAVESIAAIAIRAFVRQRSIPESSGPNCSVTIPPRTRPPTSPQRRRKTTQPVRPPFNGRPSRRARPRRYGLLP